MLRRVREAVSTVLELLASEGDAIYDGKVRGQ